MFTQADPSSPQHPFTKLANIKQDITSMLSHDTTPIPVRHKQTMPLSNLTAKPARGCSTVKGNMIFLPPIASSKRIASHHKKKKRKEKKKKKKKRQRPSQVFFPTRDKAVRRQPTRHARQGRSFPTPAPAPIRRPTERKKTAGKKTPPEAVHENVTKHPPSAPRQDQTDASRCFQDACKAQNLPRLLAWLLFLLSMPCHAMPCHAIPHCPFRIKGCCCWERRKQPRGTVCLHALLVYSSGSEQRGVGEKERRKRPENRKRYAESCRCGRPAIVGLERVCW
ncbi:hypothetical protein BT67DRAFT_39948 [Trichocladium antarcticum]|uniref:Uncharacterized protein n=1 Tax=Trichocladium antarcticum TaxID=1450529 RepID=A0AAN6UIK1_9PEZI|nr:hypothetical protein BT67DRAFT_39948 [Trichocladium antarcticum]